MRRVQVESPFAPRTPLPQRDCYWGDEPQCPKKPGLYCASCEKYFLTAIEREREAQLHARYLALCLRDCLNRDETPYASHGLLTLPDVLRDEVPEERERGIAAGFAMRHVMHATVIYVDCYADGWRSGGMQRGEAHAHKLLHPVEYRQLRDTCREWIPREYRAV